MSVRESMRSSWQGVSPPASISGRCVCEIPILKTQQERVWGSGLLYFSASELIVTHLYHQEEVKAGLFCEMQWFFWADARSRDGPRRQTQERSIRHQQICKDVEPTNIGYPYNGVLFSHKSRVEVHVLWRGEMSNNMLNETSQTHRRTNVVWTHLYVAPRNSQIHRQKIEWWLPGTRRRRELVWG